MHIRKLLALVLLGLSLTAAADFTTITEAYEVNSGDMRLPRNTGGTLTFKQLLFVDLLEAPEGVRGGGYLKRTPKRCLTDCDILSLKPYCKRKRQTGI